MTEQELQNIIDQLTVSHTGEDAFFGIFQYGGGMDESYIKANKEGLALFAAELLKAVGDAKHLDDTNQNEYVIELHDDVWLEEGEVFINVILLGIGFILMIIGLLTIIHGIL